MGIKCEMILGYDGVTWSAVLWGPSSCVECSRGSRINCEPDQSRCEIGGIVHFGLDGLLLFPSVLQSMLLCVVGSMLFSSPAYVSLCVGYFFVV